MYVVVLREYSVRRGIYSEGVCRDYLGVWAVRGAWYLIGFKRYRDVHVSLVRSPVDTGLGRKRVYTWGFDLILGVYVE